MLKNLKSQFTEDEVREILSLAQRHFHALHSTLSEFSGLPWMAPISDVMIAACRDSITETDTESTLVAQKIQKVFGTKTVTVSFEFGITCLKALTEEMVKNGDEKYLLAVLVVIRNMIFKAGADAGMNFTKKDVDNHFQKLKEGNTKIH